MRENLCDGCTKNKDGECKAKSYTPANAAKLARGEAVTYCPFFALGRRRALQERN